MIPPSYPSLFLIPLPPRSAWHVLLLLLASRAPPPRRSRETGHKETLSLCISPSPLHLSARVPAFCAASLRIVLRWCSGMPPVRERERVGDVRRSTQAARWHSMQTQELWIVCQV